jgi:Reverse transcriptase (RNA-dependent DNA polymerase)
LEHVPNDYKNVFFQGTLEEEVYMTLLPGHKREGISNLICRLKKLIYRLIQFPRAWYGKLSHFLISCNFKVSDSDSSLFIKNNTHGIIIVLVYVDYITITGDNKVEIDYVKKDLKKI